MITIDRAQVTDAEDVTALLNNAAGWLHSRGIAQWPRPFTAERTAAAMVSGSVYLVRDSQGAPIATGRLSPEADLAFWAEDEAAEMAMYVSGLAIDRAHAGLGEQLLRWLTDRAAQLSYRWVRLDCRRDNERLHRYYLDRGWQHVRTVTAPGRHSGALFQRPAVPDLAARAAFGRTPAPGGWLDLETRVVVAGRGPGTITAFYPPAPDSGMFDASAGALGDWDALPGYWVKLDDGPEVRAVRGDVTALPVPCGAG